MRFASRSHSRHPERGTAAVEFSLVVPLLVAVTIGTIDAGKMVVAKQMCAYAAIVGARTGIASATANSTVVQNAAIAAAPLLHLTTSDVTVAVTVGSTAATRAFGARTRGDTVTVTVGYTFTPVIPLLTKLATKSYSVKSAMVVP
ncbi:MAG TPA: TadE/TadG family type IV pilus assembly protein [Polyangia bacterium]|nr:TadE/TadG family type IV pilus assembly protein [Polyangia bacterium]